MFSRKILFLSVLLWSFLPSFSQKIVYSGYGNDDTRRMNFDVIGKLNGNFLVYKNVRNNNWITVYDNDMQEIAKVKQDYLPDMDRVINVDFFPYNDFFYMIYQYQRKSIVHCMAAKIDGNGNKIGEVMELDTTKLGFSASNKIYTVLSSEDKSRLIVFKINSKNKSKYIISTVLLDDKLTTLKKSRLTMPMDDRDDFLGEFNLDNEGDLVFTKFFRGNNDNISKAAFVVKAAQSDNFQFRELNLEKTNLDEIRIKVDNANKRYFLTSFFYKQRRGSIDGLYYYIWDKEKEQLISENTFPFSEELRKEAKGEANLRTAFNDYFIKNIITRKDGGFIIGSEAYYTTSKFSNWNRWDYLYRYSYFSPLDYYSYSPYYSSWWGYNRWNNNNQAVRHHADNITVLSFDKDGKLEWSNVMVKEQYDDQADDHLSYILMVTGGQLHFLFNQQEKRVQLLNDYSITPDGKINRNPTLKNLDKGYEFMPRYGKQVSARQLIVPCIYRNFICFAKVDYN
ncbi:MAG TPA: hypothetical protein VF476_15485 [Chitinophagaceae bacterium]